MGHYYIILLKVNNLPKSMETEVLKKLIENSQSNLINTGKQGQRGCHEQYKET